MTNETLEISEEKKVLKDTLLICVSSGSKSHLGKVALIDRDYGYFFGGFMGLLVPQKAILPKFLFWQLRSEEYRCFIESLTEGTNINNLKFSDLSDFSICLPPLAVQERIVGIIDRTFEKIVQLEQNCQKITADCEEVKKAILAKAFRGEL